MAQALPGDVETLTALLLKERAEHAAALLAKHRADAENERLRQIIKALQRHRFGRRAETLDPDQLALGLEDVEQEIAASEAGAEGTSPAAKTERAAKRRANRGSLPAHLPRIETVVARAAPSPSTGMTRWSRPSISTSRANRRSWICS